MIGHTLINTLNSGPPAVEDEDKDSVLQHAVILESCSITNE